MTNALHECLSYTANKLLAELTVEQEKENAKLTTVPIYAARIPKGVLYDVYINSFAPDQQQQHRCSACHKFINRYGGLSVLRNNRVKSLLWNEEDAPEELKKSFFALRTIVEHSDISHVFQSDKHIFGEKTTPLQNDGKTNMWRTQEGWHHLNLDIGAPQHKTHAYDNSRDKGAAMSRSIQDFHQLSRGLEMVDLRHYAKVLGFFETDVRVRTRPAHAARLKRYLAYVATYQATKALQRGQHANVHLAKNYIWQVVAHTTPDIISFHNTAVGTFVTDWLTIDTRMDLSKESYAGQFNTALSHFLTQTTSENYLRPRVAPKAATIKQASDLIREMNLESGMVRRHAALADFSSEYFFWRKGNAQVKDSGVIDLFANLKTSDTPKPTNGNAQRVDIGKVTFEAFVSQILPHATRIRYIADPVNAARNDPWMGFLTANDPDATPILRYDKLEDRNPISQFAYNNPRHNYSWGVQDGQEVDVLGVINAPAERGDRANYTKAVFLLQGARAAHGQVGMALFPEILHPRLHGVRSVIEEYSKQHAKDHPDAIAGVQVPDAGNIALRFVVTGRRPDLPDIHVTIDRLRDNKPNVQSILTGKPA